MPSLENNNKSNYDQKRSVTDQSLKDERSSDQNTNQEITERIEQESDAKNDQNRQSADVKRKLERSYTDNLEDERKNSDKALGKARRNEDKVIKKERTEKESISNIALNLGRETTDSNLLSEREHTDSQSQQDTDQLSKEIDSHDITKNALKEGERNLAISKLAEEKYRGLLESAHDAIIVVGLNGMIEFSNAQVSKWFGYTNQELIGKPIEILVPKRFQVRHVIQRDEYLENPTKRPMGREGLDLKGRRKDGSEFPIDIALSPSGTEDQKYVTAIIRDTTDRHRFKAQDQFLSKASRILAASLVKEETLLKAASLITTEIADGCVLLLYNEKYKLEERAVSHRDPLKEHLLKNLVRSIVSKNKWPMESSKILLVVEPSELILNHYAVENERDQMSHLDIISFVSIPLMIQGQIRGVLSLFLDESKRHFDESFFAFFESVGTLVTLSIENARLYEEAQRAIKVREEILSVVSHDLKNPLTSISMISQLLLRFPETDPTKLIKYSQKIKRSTDQMERMIDDLMDFSKIQVGKLSIEKKLEKPKALIEMVFEMMKDSAEEKGLKFTTEAGPKLHALEFDKQRMAQALMNLVGNAIKFTEKDGKVILSASESEEAISFSVSDTGPGIPPENLDKIFNKYWQAQESKAVSVGLGLPISKGIAEAHGGTISVQSQLGIGTTFHISIPRNF